MSAPRVHPAIERMDGADAAFTYLETPTVHMHTLKIAILEPSEHLDFDSFAAGTLSRLKRLPPMRRRMVKVPFGLNHPMWVTLPRVDPQRHLHRHRVPGDGSMRDLEVLIGRIASTQLDRRFPLWELHYCEGLADGRVAVVGKMHHALADGAAANALLGNVTDVRTAEVPPPPDDIYESTDHVPGRLWLMRRALLDAFLQAFSLPALLLRTARGLRAALRYRGEHGRDVPKPVLDAPRTSFNGSLTAARSFATVTLPFDEVRRIRAQHEGVTINDIVLAVVSGAMRRWLEAHDEHPTRSLDRGGSRRRRPARGRTAPGREPRLQHVHHVGHRRRRSRRASAPDIANQHPGEADPAAHRPGDADGLGAVHPTQRVPRPRAGLLARQGCVVAPGGVQRDRLQRPRTPGTGRDRRSTAQRHVQRRTAGRRHRPQRDRVELRLRAELLAARLHRPACPTCTCWRRTSPTPWRSWTSNPLPSRASVSRRTSTRAVLV